MISLFTGGFLSDPCPLELSFNHCSAKCAFCFANLTVPDRTVDMKKVMSQIQRHQDSPTLVARLLRDKYPILISNRVDPFAKSNYQQAVPVMRVLTDLGIPYAIASRGGDGVDEVLSFAPRMVWYLSINQDQENIRKRIEPGGTTIESRVQLCEKLAKLGHVVHIGFNPYVPEWWEDFPGFARRLKDAGATGAYFQRIHINPKQRKNMTAKEIEAMGPVMKQAMNFKTYDYVPLQEAAVVAKDIGFHVYVPDLSSKSELDRDYRAVYDRVFPTNSDFVDWSLANIPASFPILSFADYCNVLAPSFPTGRFTLREYVGSASRQLLLDHTFNQGTFEDLLRIVWMEPEMRQSPIKLQEYSWAGRAEDPQEIFVDEQDQPYMIFSPDGFKDDEDIVESRQYFPMNGGHV